MSEHTQVSSLRLPSPEKLSRLVSNVTETMLDLHFHIAADQNGDAAATTFWRTALLPIPGKVPVVMALSSDERGCTALAAAMFSCDSMEVDESMINDALSELANMAAGQLKGILSLQQPLGLPRVLEKVRPKDSNGSWHEFLLQGHTIHMWLSISTEDEIAREYE